MTADRAAYGIKRLHYACYVVALKLLEQILQKNEEHVRPMPTEPLWLRITRNPL